MEVYADNAATARMNPKAIDAMVTCMERVYGNPSSIHRIGAKALDVLQRSRERIARCIGCSPGEIYFTSGGSEADNQAIMSAAELGLKEKKLHIVSTAFEHHAVLHTLEKLKRRGFDIELLPVNERGMISISQLEKAIREDTCLVTIMYANNEIGTILPVSEIGQICRDRGVLFHTDAVQAVGCIPVDVRKQNIDMLSLSGHKFGGPKGIGALYARRGIDLINIIEGGTQEQGRRGGTENVPAAAGMAEALDEACIHMEENREKVTAMRDRLIRGLEKIPDSLLNGDRENRLPGNVSFCFDGVEGENLLFLLDERGICASSGSACTSGSLTPSHVLLAMGRSPEMAQSSLRLSLNGFNTTEEVDYIIEEISKIAEHLRRAAENE